VLQALKRTLDRLYEERGLDVELASIPGLKFQGEKQDFEEMVVRTAGAPFILAHHLSW